MTAKTSRKVRRFLCCTLKVKYTFFAVCDSFSKGTTFVIDVTWIGNEEAHNITTYLNVPYIRIDLSISSTLSLLDKYLNLRNFTDVVVIFEDSRCKL